jgi:hypothetical protein
MESAFIEDEGALAIELCIAPAFSASLNGARVCPVNQELASLNLISTVGLGQSVQEKTIVPGRMAILIITKVLATHCKFQPPGHASHDIAKLGMCLRVRNEEEIVSTSIVLEEISSSRLMETFRMVRHPIALTFSLIFIGRPSMEKEPSSWLRFQESKVRTFFGALNL